MKKRFIAANDLLLDSFRLAADIYQSGFRPDFLVGLWRGGSAVGIAVQEGLDHFGVDTDHIAIRTSYRGQHSYTDMVNSAKDIRAHGLRIVCDLLHTHTQLITNAQALADPWKKQKIDQIALLLQASLLAHQKVALSMNVPADRVERARMAAGFWHTRL